MVMKNFHESTILLVSLLFFVFGVSLLVSDPKDRTFRLNDNQNLRHSAVETTTGLPDRRNLAGYDAIRRGKCSEVKYGNLTWDDELDPFILPVNELMIHLDHPAYVSPPNQYGINDMGPVIVDIGLYIHQISEVDVGFNSFFMEGFVDLVWCDSRLKFEADKAYKKKHYYLEKDAEKELEEIWWPDLTFVNEIGKRTSENQELIIEYDGTIEYREKFAVHLTSSFITKQFPFDKQVLTAEIESFAWNSTTLEFHVEEDLVGFSHNFRIPEFKMMGIHEHVEIKQEPRDRYPFSDLVTDFYIERDPGYYVTKVLIPLSLIVAISWSVFWMDCWDLGDRMAISFTGILTAVAYQFIISDKLPSHVSDTFLDNFILLSFFNLVFTVIINILVHRGHSNGYCNEAIFIDKVCRILFPVMFILGSICLALVQLVGEGLPSGAVLGVTFASLAVVISLIAVYVIQKRRKKQIRKISRFFGRKTQSERASQLKKNKHNVKHHYDSDDQSGGSFDQFKGIKAMIKKKDENIDDAQFKINSLQKQLAEEKLRREKMMEKREQLARISGTNMREDREKLVAELDLDIKKKKEEINTTFYRITSLKDFVKGQESVKVGLVKQKNQLVEINVQGMQDFSDIESDGNNSVKLENDDSVEQEVLFYQYSEDVKSPTSEQEDEKNTTKILSDIESDGNNTFEHDISFNQFSDSGKCPAIEEDEKSPAKELGDVESEEKNPVEHDVLLNKCFDDGKSPTTEHGDGKDATTLRQRKKNDSPTDIVTPGSTDDN